MRRGHGLPASVLAGLLITSGLALTPLPAGSAAGPSAAPAGLVVTVSGAGTESYPAYDAAVPRFGLLSAEETQGTVEVTVTADDPAARVTVNGVRTPLGRPHEVSGLRPGDEVNVQVASSARDTNQSWIYLPPGFPRLSATGSLGSLDHRVFLGLSSFLADTGFETVVDARGVPVHLRAAAEPHDFRAHVHGPDYTVFEPVKEGPEDSEYGYQVREYDAQYRLEQRQRLRPVAAIGLTPDDTDFHDVQYLPDGRMVLLGYQRTWYGTPPDAVPWLDAVIQVVGLDGEPDLTWTSRGEIRPEEAYVLGAKGQDYAHVNSLDMQPDGDLVASFRNTGQVLRIATSAHDGHQPGEVVWRLGGERNEFTFLDDPFGGFCAQHDARILPNGHLTLFDNGSRLDTDGPVAPQTADMCPDPADPDGPRVARPQSRIVEYALDTEAMTATLVWSHVPEGRYAAFAGNAQHLADGSFLAGWSRSEAAGQEGAESAPIATRVTRDGEETWALRSNGWFSYRATAAPAPDAIAPRFRVDLPRPRASYPQGTRIVPDFSCLDRGGSNLTDCEVVSVTGGDPSAPGRHVITFRADDGAGNEATRSFPYEVAPLRQPDLQVRAGADGWLGADRWPERRVVHAADRFTRAGQRIGYRAQVVNAGLEGEPFRLHGRGSGDGWIVRYFDGDQDVTRAMVRGRLFTPRLTPGGSWSFRVVLRRTSRVAHGAERLTWVRARSSQNELRTDRIALESRAR